MKDFHPEIKKFWEDNGWKIVPGTIWDAKYKSINYWNREKPPPILANGYYIYNSRIAARYFEIDGDLYLRYFLDPFDNGMYTENEMLRIVRMKAFL